MNLPLKALITYFQKQAEDAEYQADMYAEVYRVPEKAGKYRKNSKLYSAIVDLLEQVEVL